MGLLRLLTNPKVLSESHCSIQRAFRNPRTNTTCGQRRVFFEYEPLNWRAAWAAMMQHPAAKASSWTDAYLAAFAQKHGYEMATFDHDFKRWTDLKLSRIWTSRHFERVDFTQPDVSRFYGDLSLWAFVQIAAQASARFPYHLCRGADGRLSARFNAAPRYSPCGAGSTLQPSPALSRTNSGVRHPPLVGDPREMALDFEPED